MKLTLSSLAIACALVTPVLFASCGGSSSSNGGSGATVDASTMAGSTLDCSGLTITMEAGAPTVVINSMVFGGTPNPVDPNVPTFPGLTYENGTVTITMTIDGTPVTFTNVDYEYGIETDEGTVYYDLEIGDTDEITDTTGKYSFTMGLEVISPGMTSKEAFDMNYTGGNTVSLPYDEEMTVTVNADDAANKETYEGTFAGNTTKTFAN